MRDFVVLHPLRVVLTNVPQGSVHALTAPNFPRDPSAGSHALTVSRVIYIEEDDFREVDDKDYFGLAPGKTAGLRYAGFLRVDGYTKDAGTGRVTELQCTYDADRAVLGKDASTGKEVKVKGNLHFVSGDGSGDGDAPAVEVRLYDHLFTTETAGSTGDWESEINTQSETVLCGARANPALLTPGRVGVLDKLQLERVGYFVVDPDSDLREGGVPGRVARLVLNQTVGLKEAAAAKKVKGRDA